MVYTIVSIICILLMACLLLCLALRYATLNRAERIAFIKNFKKGKCVIIYLITVPMFFMSSYYNGMGVADSIFNSIAKSLYLVVLRFELGMQLCAENLAFCICVYLSYTLVTLNALMITFSLINQSLWNWFSLNSMRKGKGSRCIILGYNDNSRYIYKSCNVQKLIAGTLTKAEQDKMFEANIHYKSCAKIGKLEAWLKRELEIFLKKLDGGKEKVNIIINEKDDKTNLDLCSRLIEIINGFKADAVNYIDIYVFGSCEYEDLYAKYEEKSKGCLHYVNEYRQIAVDFIDNYPLTGLMTEEQIDYDASLVKSNAEINVAMIGFGRTNRQIFLSMAANNQFLTSSANGKIEEKQVRYFLFDKKHSVDSATVNQDYYRYKHYFFNDDGSVKAEGEYLPLPALPTIDEYLPIDTDDISFFDALETTLCKNANAVTAVVVSLGEDYLSICVANKVVAFLKEKGMKNYRVFVRVHDKGNGEAAGLFTDTTLCRSFGSKESVVYDYGHIILEKFTEMAIMRNYDYDAAKDDKNGKTEEEFVRESRLKWFVEKTVTQKESNVYACLSLRYKLNLMGLDYCRADENEEEVGYDEYLKIYAGDEKIIGEDGKIEIDDSEKNSRSRRRILAETEHFRWNAFMIMKGFVPATVEEIKTAKDENGEYTDGKDFELRHHGNLTTYAGLEKFGEIIAERDGKTTAEADVKKYDYQLLDDAWLLLKNNGYKIYKRG